MNGDVIIGTLLMLLLLAVGVVIYFLPSYVAVKRCHKNAGAIIALNILTGWTFLGWVVSLVWALKAE